MSREIKFRAWDKGNKRMIDWDEIGLELEDGYVGVTRYIRYADSSMNSEKIDEFELMQYTGLKDKNGKEIYESDLLQYDNEVYEVYWSQDWAMFTVNGPQIQALMRYAEYGEVIGNVFERDKKI